MSAIQHRADLIIRNIRTRTGNAAYSSTSGIQQREIVQYLNDAQERIYNKILQANSSLFQQQAYLPTQYGVAAVPLPTDSIYLDHNIVAVMYSFNGNPINYAPLELRTVRQEISVVGYPNGYFLMGSNLYLVPIPANTVANALKITYQYVIPELDIRRATVSAVTGAAPTLTSVTLAQDSYLITESESDLSSGWVDYVCFVDKDGNQLAEGKPVVSYDSTTKILTMNTTLGATETVPVGCYLVFGKNATTTSPLPKICERYLTEYGVMRTQMRDSNSEAAETTPLLTAIETEIIEAVEELEEDIFAIPIGDNGFLNYADEL
jgi:hypothetical protein